MYYSWNPSLLRIQLTPKKKSWVWDICRTNHGLGSRSQTSHNTYLIPVAAPPHPNRNDLCPTSSVVFLLWFAPYTFSQWNHITVMSREKWWEEKVMLTRASSVNLDCMIVSHGLWNTDVYLHDLQNYIGGVVWCGVLCVYTMHRGK